MLLELNLQRFAPEQREIYVNGTTVEIWGSDTWVWSTQQNFNPDLYTCTETNVLWNDGTILQYNGVDVLPSDEIHLEEQYTTRTTKTAKETYIDLMSELANTINELTGYSDSINLATIVERAKTIVKPTGSYTVNANGTYDVTNYVSVVVNVPNPTLSGTAKANQVVKGATFYSDSYTLLTGTFEGLIPDGNAIASNVLAGKTFYGNGTTKLTGSIETYSGSTTITSNGTINVGGMYVGSNLTVNVPATPTQEKSVTITENGTTEVTPDSGKNLSKVTITTNVAGVTEVSTSTEMDNKLAQANVGQYYKYTGTTDDKYTNGDIYQVESDS